jgi:PAS domain S-box-containing protein
MDLQEKGASFPKENPKLLRLSRELNICRAELEQARSYLQGILQNSTDMIFATDVEGILFSFSLGGERILGFSAAELLGTKVSELAVKQERLQEALREAGEKGSLSLLDVPFKTKGGQEAFCNVSLVALRNRRGEQVGTIGICQDITRWKSIQESLKSIERFAEMGRLAAGIAHEINNPLAVIQEIAGWGITLLSDQKEKDKITAELQKALEDILEQTKRGSSITHQLLGFVREAPPTIQPLDLAQVVARAVGFLRHELSKALVQVEIIKPEGELWINSDPRMLEQLLVNLLSNGLDAIKEKAQAGGLIRVVLQASERAWEIQVIDNGTGIAPEHVERVFELLFTTKGPGKGTGLGLPICRRIATQLGGDIQFWTRPGEGTCFLVRLPRDPRSKGGD